MLITTLFQVRPEVHRKPRNNVGSHSMTKRISEIRDSKPSDSECNVLSLCVTHPESVPETINHLVASFFSRNYKTFSLILNIFHTLSQCYYSNFLLAGNCCVNFFSNWYSDFKIDAWIYTGLINLNILMWRLRKRKKCIITEIPVLSQTMMLNWQQWWLVGKETL